MAKLTHVDGKGNARMVDISEKKETKREAVAAGRVKMSAATYELIRKGQGPKGDIFNRCENSGHHGRKEDPRCHSPLAILCQLLSSTWIIPSMIGHLLWKSKLR